MKKAVIEVAGGEIVMFARRLYAHYNSFDNIFTTPAEQFMFLMGSCAPQLKSTYGHSLFSGLYSLQHSDRDLMVYLPYGDSKDDHTWQHKVEIALARAAGGIDNLKYDLNYVFNWFCQRGTF